MLCGHFTLQFLTIYFPIITCIISAMIAGAGVVSTSRGRANTAHWECSACTFHNESHAESCVICGSVQKKSKAETGVLPTPEAVKSSNHVASTAQKKKKKKKKKKKPDLEKTKALPSTNQG